MSLRLLPWLRRLACVLLIAVTPLAVAQTSDRPFTKEQLDQLTAQIALYPDALLSQVLMASTYPADVAEAARWSRANSQQKGDEAVRMVENENWDPSVKSLVAFPQVIITMGEKPDWVKDLGDAFLAQPDDVMDSVQRLRAAAQNAGNLQSNDDVVVRVDNQPPPQIVVEASAPPPPPQVIVIEQRNPDVIFVPVYNPAYVFGPWMWPAYPPVFVPPPPGFWFSTAVATGIAWGIGIGVRNAIWGSPNWWNRSVNINVNNFNNINVNNRISNTNVNQRWSHNVDNRRNVAYRGGDQTRQQLQNRAQQVNRDQYRGRDLDRQRAQQSMQNRGISTDRSQLSDANRANLQQQARSLDRGGQGFDRSAAQNRAQSVDRSAAQNRAQSFDRSAAQNRAQSFDRGSTQGRPQASNEAFRGVGDNRAGQEFNRGNASRQSAQSYRAPSPMERTGGGGGGTRPQMGGGGGGGARPQMGGGGGGGARPQMGGGGGGGGGGGARPQMGGGGGRPGGGGGGRGR